MSSIENLAIEMTMEGEDAGLEAFRLAENPKGEDRNSTDMVIVDSAPYIPDGDEMDMHEFSDRAVKLTNELEAQRNLEYESFSEADIEPVVRPTVISVQSFPYFNPKPTFHEMWVKNREPVIKTFEKMEEAQNKVITSSEGGKGPGKHTPESIEAVSDYHEALGLALGYPECCVEEFSERKAERMLEGLEFVENNDISQFTGIGSAARELDAPQAPETQASINDHERNNWQTLWAYAKIGELDKLADDFPNGMYGRIGNDFFPVDGEQVCENAIARGKEIEESLETAEGIKLYRTQLMRNMAYHMIADYEMENEISQTTDFFEDMETDDEVEPEMEELAEAYRDDRLTEYFVNQVA